MFSIIAAFSLIALVNADTVVPIESSQVDVRQSGAEFSYNIKENRGVAAISSDAAPVVPPLIKSIHIDPKPVGNEHVKEGRDETVPHEQKPEARAHMDVKEFKKPAESTIIAQPFIAPLEYIPIFTHHVLPKASLIAPVSAIPYPYTLIRTV